MRRIIEQGFVTRLATLTALISVLAVVVPLAALAAGGDPGGI